MTKPKKIVCLCEDVTKEDLEVAVKTGFGDFELLKRFTGVCTGPCQGKFCLMNVIELLSEMSSIKPELINIPALRPPFRPTRLAILRGDVQDVSEGQV
jgi:bacterioferritin-associated ferredoxin